MIIFSTGLVDAGWLYIWGTVMVWYKMYWSSVVKPSKVQLGDHSVI